MTEISGTFSFDGQSYKAGYRYGGKWYDQGGYSKCLRIYNNVINQSIYAHDIFGDDKFDVENAVIENDKVILTMRFPLCRKDDFNPLASRIIIINRT